MPDLAMLHSSTFVQGFSNNERQAAARALLRHNAHVDGTHYQTKTPGGLHPSYIAFHSTTAQQPNSGRTLSCKELIDATLQDVFDAIAMQDRLDGGISLLVRCPGSEAGPTISPKQIGVDLYITPQELQEVPQQIGGDVAVLVQSFSQEFAVPHLQRFTKRCNIENIKPPKHFPATNISTDGPQYLPAPLVATSAHIMCSAQAPKTFVKNLQTLSLAHADSKKLLSAVIREGVEWAASVATKTSNLTPRSQIRQRRQAEVFVADRDPGPTFSAQRELARDATSFNPPLISIGPNTDAILDRFKLGDEVLPKLRLLIQTVHSSHWESILRAQAWDLPYEQAALLSRALLADLQGVPFNPEIVKVHNSNLCLHSASAKVTGC